MKKHNLLVLIVLFLSSAVLLPVFCRAESAGVKNANESKMPAALGSELEELKARNEAIMKKYIEYKEIMKDELNRVIVKYNAKVNTLESMYEIKEDELKKMEQSINPEIEAYKRKIELLQRKLDISKIENDERHIEIAAGYINKLKEREQEFQESITQMELYMKARLDEEREARLMAEKELMKLKQESKTKAGSAEPDIDKRRFIKIFGQDDEQKRITTLEIPY